MRTDGDGSDRCWRVQAVFDPDGIGGDFAYTIGLAERGLPELHVWARPTHGEDPGADWKLSARDCGHLLNACAERLLAGSLTVGTSWTEAYDDGLVHADFEVGRPVHPLDVEALGARRDAVVLPLRWSLHRPPAGRLGPVDELAERQARSELARLQPALDRAAVARLPPAWRPATAPSFDPRQRFGPLTPLVVATGAAVATADVTEVCGFLDAARCQTLSHGHRPGAAALAVEARRLGRSRALDQADIAAAELTRLVAGRETQPSYRWQLVGEVMFGEASGPDRRALLHHARHLLDDAIASLLGLQVVSDEVADGARRSTSGPWVWGRTSSVAAPSPLWWAPREVMLRLRTILGPLGGEHLARLGEVHDLAMGSPRDPATTPYAEEVSWLRGVALCEPAGMPRPESWLLGTPAGAALLEQAAGDTATAPAVISTLAGMAAITTALAVADQVGSERLERVVAPYSRLLPGLAGEVAARAAA